ncbi:hypothetical protein [Shinella sp.]|uniref:hypothetical protein n=1 Tax=Shinella sp. TaxID=1870904 RepID=UPI003F72A204
MRYGELDNIWSEDLSGLSGAAIGRVYGERAVEVLVPRSVDPSLYTDKGVIDLDRARELIGCKRSTLYQNRVVRAIIEDLQRRDLDATPATVVDTQDANKCGNVVKFPVEKTRQPSRYERGKIVVADLMLPYKLGVQRRFQIPTLFWAGTVDYEVADYMRSLAVGGRPLSTLLEYMKIIREFRRFCRERGMLWSMVCDDVLRAYRATKLNKGVQTRRINTVIGVIFQFYAWAERTGRLRDRVQLHNEPDYPEEMRHHPFAIGSNEFTTKDGRKIRVSKLWLDDSTKYPNRPTPNDDAIELVYDTQDGLVHEERNTLAFSFSRVMASRSFETLQVSVAQLPTRAQLDRIYDGSLPWSFTVTRKGQRQGKLYPTPDLLLRILNYVEFHRSKIVESCKAAGRFVSNKLFLTDQGTPLSVGALGELTRKAFQKAGVPGSYHRLRAARAQEEVERALDAVDVGDVELGPETLWKHSILMKAADFLDHTSLRSLEFYLNDLINSRVQKSTGAKLHIVEEALAEKTRALVEVEKRLQRASGLWRADPVLAEFIFTGDLKNPSPESRRQLREFRDEIELFEANFAEAA